MRKIAVLGLKKNPKLKLMYLILYLEEYSEITLLLELHA